MKLAVFGASGATGRHLVRLASTGGTTVSVLVRAEAAKTGIKGAKMLVIGDATDPADAAATLKGADAVAICLGISRRSRSPFAP
jgi:uncharacterized protein YbjT (DUF2867 family)